MRRWLVVVLVGLFVLLPWRDVLASAGANDGLSVTRGLPRRPQASVPNEWLVSPDGPLPSIHLALELAQPGDIIRVMSGVYLGNLVVDKPVRLLGEGQPVIDGGGEGMVVSLEAPGSELIGFTIRGSGSEPDRDHAGIVVRAPDVLVQDNQLYDVLFGIFVAQADRAVLRGNTITSKAEFDLARKGDGVRVWYSNDVIIEGNRVFDSRDVVAWYSNNLVFRDNTIQNGRYAVHLMYCDRAEITGNTLLDNSVGVYVMYSRQVDILGNDIRRQRGPSGYALGFKDSDNVLAQDNLLVDNRAGLFLDGTPYRPGSYARFEANILAFNDIGAILFSFVKGAEFRGNTLWENIEQVALQGSGTAGANLWLGNYWTDYPGYDGDGDGFGDLPYQSERFFEGLMDQEPRLRAMLFSPAAQAIEFAATSFPVIKPLPKLEDPTPAMQPAHIPVSAQPDREPVTWLVLSGTGLLGLGALLVSLGAIGDRTMPTPKTATPTTQVNAGVLVQIDRLSKTYGKARVLHDIHLQVQAGESVALWGENGAGKTTLIKSLLGLITFDGQIQIAGQDVRKHGKQTRAQIGYVPQEALYYDMSVGSTLRFYAALRKVERARIPLLLEKLGLASHQHKAVAALSGGLKQRLALAIALLADPPLLLLDEPTANLDAPARRDYLALLGQLRREGKTLVFASHRVDEVETLADRVVVLQGGHFTEELSPSSVRLRLAPHVALTLWITETQRQPAMDSLLEKGWQAHLNGRGTVVVEVEAREKLDALQHLQAVGIHVDDFEMEGVNRAWN